MNSNVTKIRNKVVSIVFLVTIAGMSVLIISSLIIQRIEYRRSSNYEEWDASVYYPLDGNDEAGSGDSVYQSILDKINFLETKIEGYATSSFYYRVPFVLVKKACDKTLGLDMTTSLTAGENDISDSSDIVLSCNGPYLGRVMDDVDISGEIDSVVAFGKQMEAEGRNFLFFATPGKYGGNEVYQDYSEEKEEELLKAFEKNNLDIFRVSDAIEEEGKDFYSVFFKADHHWLPSSGIWADGLLCETLNSKYGYDFDTSVFEVNNYETTILKNHFLGSLGKKVTEVYSEKEDFPIIRPKYDTDLGVFISGENGNQMISGCIEDTLFDVSAIEGTDSYSGDEYAFYGCNNKALVTIHNNEIDDGSHILMVKTSYANCMYPYLAAVVEDLDVIDLRLFNGSLQSYIDATDPDTVVMVYGIGAFQEVEIKGGIFDFR